MSTPTRADLNNNPANIKVPNGGLAVAQQRYGDPGLSIDTRPATDGGNFLKFSSPQYGDNATSTLLKSPTYSSLSVNDALHTWSGGGYNGDIVPSLKNSKISDLNPDQLNTVKQAMYKREGYTGQSTSSSSPTQSGKMSIEDFGKKIQGKYSQYSDIDPSQLGQKILAKYPQYADMVDTTGQSVQTPGQAGSDGYIRSANVPQQTGGANGGNQGQNGANTQKDSGLLGQLGNRASDVAGAMDDLYNNKINPLTGGLRMVGDVAGGINDVAGSIFNNTLGRIPVVKSIMSSIAGGVSNAMNTPTGKAIASSYQKFATDHPEIASDLNAGYNIVSVIPLITGIGAIADATASTIAKQTIQKGISKSLEEAGVESADEVAQTLAEEGAATPKIIKGKTSNTLDFTQPKKILAKSLSDAQDQVDILTDAGPEYKQQLLDAKTRLSNLQKASDAVDKIHGSTIKKGIISKTGSLAKKGVILGLKYGAGQAGLGAGVRVGEDIYNHFTK